LRLARLPNTDAAGKPSEELRACVKDFDDVDVRDLKVMDSWPGINLTRVKCGETEYGINPESKRIELAFYAGNLSNDGTVSITREEAEVIASQFAREHYESLPVFTLQRGDLSASRVYCDSAAAAMHPYDFEWVQVLDGALTPNSVLVQVNPGRER
jgi:hypothetical protein